MVEGRLRRPSRSTLATAWIVAALLVAVPRRGAAQQLEPIANELQTIERVEFHGTIDVPRKELQSAIKTHSPPIWPWRHASLLRLDFVRADTSALESVFHQHGFLDAAVHARIRPGRHHNAVIVSFLVDQGPRCRIQRVDLLGVRSVPMNRLRRKLYAHAGKPFNPLYLYADTTRIAQEYRERGFLPVVIASYGRRSTAIDVRYEVEEGRVYHFGQVNLSSPGELHVRPRLVLREVTFRNGELYKESKVRETVQDIYATGMFSQVQMTPLPDSSNGQVEFDLRVRERRPRWIDAGVGSGTTERFQFSGDWGHHNIDGRGLQAVFSPRLSFDGQARFLLAHADVSLFDPWLLRSRRRAQATVYVEKRDDRTDPSRLLKQNALGVTFQIRREYGSIGRLTVTQDNVYIRERADFFTTVSQATLDSLPPRYSTHRLQLALERDTRDDPINPFQGIDATFSGDIAGGPLSGSSSFTRVVGAGTAYRAVRKTSVVAVHARAGVMEPFGRVHIFEPLIDTRVARVPYEERFRLGGTNTLRGYSEGTLPGSGGLALVQLNLELRVPLIGPFGAELFTDVGNVWARPTYVHLSDFAPRVSNRPYGPNDVRYVAGAGLRLNLPFGPLRLDVSWVGRPDPPQPNQPNPTQELRDRRPKYQFAIGPAF